MFKTPFSGILILLWIVNASFIGTAREDDPNDDCDQLSRYTFSWQFNTGCKLVPRGGVTKGPDVTVRKTPTKGWLMLQQEHTSKKEKDRLAILAMAGPYRVSFDFLEVMGFSSEFTPAQPYQSWGTEYVYVVENKPDFISLQHVMVMFLLQDEKISGPYVMKHWRQDWAFEKENLFAFKGRGVWEKTEVDASAIKGSWAQSVFQVDDSPRYESYGYWKHEPGFSTWRSQLTKRPLPRRESSYRDDYDLLEGYNRHTILPSGWVQEEENQKLVLDDEGLPDVELPYLSKELGIARYEAIVGHDFSAGDAYWKETASFWQIVRSQWRERIASLNTANISKSVDGRALFEVMFEHAAQYQAGRLSDEEALKLVSNAIDQILE